jgi:hypothetical protein
MFSRDELIRYINELLASSAIRWSLVYALLDIRYTQARGEEQITLYSGGQSFRECDQVIVVDPRAYWVHSAMHLSFLWRVIYGSEYWAKWNDREEQDIILRDWLNRALCQPLAVSDFYGAYHRLTQGRLPRALEDYEPISEAMCMEDAWSSKSFLLKNARSYVTFSWGTSA